MNRPSAFREYLEAVLVAAVFALFAKAFVFEGFEIPSSSMEPNLLVGDHIFVNKFVYAPHRGPWAPLLPYRDVLPYEVVVFRSPKEPERDLIKRVVGLPGDVVAIKRKQVIRNGRALVEPEVEFRDPETYDRPDEPAALRVRDNLDPFTVPQGHLFALGDNRDLSQDSRYWGTVPLPLVRGRALLVYWSYEPGRPPRVFSGRGAALRRFVDTALHFFERTRWSRTLHAIR